MHPFWNRVKKKKMIRKTKHVMRSKLNMMTLKSNERFLNCDAKKMFTLLYIIRVFYGVKNRTISYSELVKRNTYFIE